MHLARRRVVRAEFTELEQFAGVQRDGAADHLQFGPGRLRLQMAYGDFGPLRMQVNAVDNEYLARAQFHPGRWAMFIDVGAEPGVSRINGSILGRDGAALFGPGAELHAHVARGQAWCMFTFESEPVARMLDGPAWPRAGEFLFAPELLRQAPRLAALARDLSAVMAADPARLEGQAVEGAVVDSVIAHVAGALHGEASRPGGRARQRQLHLVAAAVDLLDASLDQPVYTLAVASALGVGTRTLNEAFRAVYGTSLHHWLRLRRLALARTWLRDPDGPTLIKQIALDAGFWHFGRFARAYRLMFGETPSETLAGRAAARVVFVPVLCAPSSSATLKAGD